MYITIARANGVSIDSNYETWGRNTLMFKVAYNIFRFDKNNKEYLNKVCELNDLIEISKEEDDFKVCKLNLSLRKKLFKKLIEFDDQDSLDKANHILIDQILLNSDGINIEEINVLKHKLFWKYYRYGDQNNLDKVYCKLFDQMSPNPEKVFIESLNDLKYYLALVCLKLNTQESIEMAIKIFNSIDEKILNYREKNGYFELCNAIEKLQSAEQDFKRIQAEQQTCMLNEDANNHVLVTNEFKDKIEEVNKSSSLPN